MINDSNLAVTSSHLGVTASQRLAVQQLAEVPASLQKNIENQAEKAVQARQKLLEKRAKEASASASLRSSASPKASAKPLTSPSATTPPPVGGKTASASASPMDAAAATATESGAKTGEQQRENTVDTSDRSHTGDLRIDNRNFTQPMWSCCGDQARLWQVPGSGALVLTLEGVVLALSVLGFVLFGIFTTVIVVNSLKPQMK